MPLSKVSYPYPNDTLAIPKAAIASLFTEGFNSDSTIFTSTSSGNRISIQTDGNAARINFGSTVNPLAYGTVGAYSNLFNIQATGRSIVTTTDAPSLTTLITRGAVAQSASLQSWQNSAGLGLASISSTGFFQTFGSVGVYSDRLSGAQLSLSTGSPGNEGIIVRGFGVQTADLQQWQSSTPSTVAKVDSSGNFAVQNDNARIRAIRGIATAQTTAMGADSGSGWVGSESNTQFQIVTNNTARMTFAATGSISTPNSFNVTNSSNVLLSTDSGGSISMGRADNVASSPYIDFNSGATTVDFDVRVQASGGTGVIGQGNLTITGNTTVDGNLTVNGTTTTINSTTLTVDDKNIEMGAVVAGTVSTTGTVGSITGTGPWTATITNMTDTADLIVGSAITATNGTGSLGAGGTYIIASIVSGTSVTYTATGGTTPVAGTVTNITTTGATNTTANGGGIVLKGTTDKSILWDSTNSNFTSTEHINLASTKVFKINNTQVLSNTAVLGLTPTINATGYTLSGGTTAVAVTFAGGAAYTLSGTNGQTYTFPTTGGTLITASSPTITTPVIDTINVSGAAVAAALWNTTVTTGSISMGGALTTGGVNIATGTAFNGTVAIASGAGTVNKTVNIGTASTSGTTSIAIGSVGGATSNVTIFGIADGTTTTATRGAGYMGMPQRPTSTSGSFSAADAGKHVYVTATGTTQTIPANGTVAFPIGTTIVVVNASGVSTSIAITTDTLRLANSALTGTRTLASNGMCTLLKITATSWIASGNGLT